MDANSLLQMAKSRGASDIHLTVSRPPVLRLRGELQILKDVPSLTAGDLDQIFTQITTPEDRERFKKHLELDFSYEVPDFVRLRGNAARQRGALNLALRLIPLTIPRFADLHLPEVCKDLVARPRGMVVISGPTGSGKSTTLAAMIDFLNHQESRRVVTIEDPLEFIYSDFKCSIIQRQIGDDTYSYADALKHVLRQDPDVILVGEMRDPETVAAALTLAETGHLVLSTGHAPSASQTIERMIDLFPPEERYLAQTRLANLLVGVICQILIPTLDGANRVPAAEVMLAIPAVRSLIRDGKVYQLDNIIRTHSQSGMQLMDHALVDLYRRRLISFESVLANCNDRNEVERTCSGAMVKT